MDLKQVRYFVAVADAGSFTGGARRAFVTQSTLSAAIGALERDLGVRLFDRRARGVELTADGSRVLAHARAMLRESEAMKSARHPEPRPARRVRIGLLPSIPDRLAAGVLRELAELLPRHVCHAEEATTDSLRKRLASGRLDIALTLLERSAAPGLRQLELARDAQVLALPLSWAPAGRITPAILQGKPLIVRTHCELMQAASRVLDECRVLPVVVARTDSDARALAMVGAGVGACLVPDSADPADGVKMVPVEGVTLRRRLGLQWVKGALDGEVDKVMGRMRGKIPVA